MAGPHIFNGSPVRPVFPAIPGVRPRYAHEGYLNPNLYAQGMQLAALRPASGFPGSTAQNSMLAKAALVGAALLALAPAVVAVFWPGRADQTSMRAVDLHGPILGFTQSRNRIQVRLVPPADKQAPRTQVMVRDADGDTLAIPLKRGQTWATAQLPSNIADATKLEISVE